MIANLIPNMLKSIRRQNYAPPISAIAVFGKLYPHTNIFVSYLGAVAAYSVVRTHFVEDVCSETGQDAGYIENCYVYWNTCNWYQTEQIIPTARNDCEMWGYLQAVREKPAVCGQTFQFAC